jgi:hypothetical protein
MRACIYRTARDAIRKAFSGKVAFALAFRGDKERAACANRIAAVCRGSPVKD